MPYYKQAIVLLLLVQVLTSCWGRYRYEPNTWPVSSSYWNDIEASGNNDNSNSNIIDESDLVDKFLPVIYKASSFSRRNSHFGNQQRQKKFLHDSNLQGLWAMPGRR